VVIAIDNAAFWYQSSDLNLFGRLMFLRSTPFTFLGWEFDDLRLTFDDVIFRNRKVVFTPTHETPLALKPKTLQ
jgi:hypothetical protein